MTSASPTPRHAAAVPRPRHRELLAIAPLLVLATVLGLLPRVPLVVVDFHRPQ